MQSAMILDRGTARARRALADALRAGARVTLTGSALREAARDGIAASELVPLADTVAADVPAAAEWRAPVRQGSSTGAAGAAVTVLIPAVRGVPLGLDAWLRQGPEVRVRVLANGPRAEEIAVECRRRGAEARSVRWEGHGRTRALAVADVDTPLVLLTVDDAVPRGEGFVDALRAALEEGYDVVSARHVPWPDADPVTRARLRAWTPPQRMCSTWNTVDHVCALYRSEALRSVPIPEVEIAEDWLWARHAGARGLRIGYAPGAPVLHSHPPRVREAYARTRAIHRVRRAAGEPAAVGPGVADLLRALPGAVAPGLRCGRLRVALAGAAELVGQR